MPEDAGQFLPVWETSTCCLSLVGIVLTFYLYRLAARPRYSGTRDARRRVVGSMPKSWQIASTNEGTAFLKTASCSGNFRPRFRACAWSLSITTEGLRSYWRFRNAPLNFNAPGHWRWRGNPACCA